MLVKNHNHSQFFITLDRTNELQINTIFGNVVGETIFNIFNVLKIGKLEIDENE